MPANNTKVVVLISCFNGRSDLPKCLESLRDSVDPDLQTHILVVDNASTDGSGDYIRANFPNVECIRLDPNAGFTGGNNFGYEHIVASQSDAQYVALLNVDTEVESGWLRALVDTMQNHDDAGAVQAKLLLHPDVLEDVRDDEKLDHAGNGAGKGAGHRIINTVGNRSHFLGFGFMIGYGEDDRGQYDQPRVIDFASGAAVLLRMDLLQQVGLFDQEMYMYLDDADLCWKLRQIGYQSYIAPKSVVYHKYRPNAPTKYYYYLERNRWILLLTYYRIPTLLLLLPALNLMDWGQIIFSLGQGTLGQKLRSMFYFWRPTKLAGVWRRRRIAQKRRTRRDRFFLSQFSGAIRSPVVEHPLLRWVGNPILSAYWAVVRKIIFW